MNNQGLRCSKCGGKMEVTHTKNDRNVVNRYRRCIQCGYRVFTEEIAIRDTNKKKKEDKS